MLQRDVADLAKKNFWKFMGMGDLNVSQKSLKIVSRNTVQYHPRKIYIVPFPPLFAVFFSDKMPRKAVI